MTAHAGWALTESDQVTATEQAEILALAAAAEHTDGVSPIDDQVRLDLEQLEVAATHVIARGSDGSSAIVGYAHLDHRTPDVTTAHVVVAPAHRRRGLGRALVADAMLRGERTRFNVWAHGDLPAARALATRLGLTKRRVLLQMGRSLTTDLPEPVYPPDVAVRAFEPGRDEEAWVAVNARAFHGHPEQGRLSVDDLRHRMGQPWFDPAGLFLAERGNDLLGSHWTKVHESDPDGTDRFGEVYVVGVDPSQQGLGLGKALTLTGLRYLRDQGIDRVTLYVEGDNEAALATYSRLGFTTVNVDVMYGVIG